MTISRRTAFASLALFAFVETLLGREARAETYTYDELGRLKTVTYPNGDTVTYSYDTAGNRTQVTYPGSPPPPPPPPTFNQTIQITGSAPVNLRTLANTAGYTGAMNATVVFELMSATVQGAAGTGAPNPGVAGSAGGLAIDTGSWPTSSYAIALTIHVKTGGKVYGGGGGGGAGTVSMSNSNAGGAGGDAINCQLDCTITVDAGGEIKSGGGGGGGAGGAIAGGSSYFNGGPGGGGAPNGHGGQYGNSAPASDGTSSAGGAGKAGMTGSGVAGGTGGNGGAPGSAGSAGGNGTGGVGRTNGSAGGAAGYAIRKNGHTITVSNSGTVTGTVG